MAGRRLSASRRRADEPGLHHEAADYAVGAGLLPPTTAGAPNCWPTPPRAATPGRPCTGKAAATRLTATTWRRWRATCAGRGIRHLAGDVVLDKQRFARTGSADDFASDSDKAFAVPPDALLAPESGVDHAVCAAGRRARGAGSAAGWTKSGQPTTVSQQANCERRRQNATRQPERTKGRHPCGWKARCRSAATAASCLPGVGARRPSGGDVCRAMARGRQQPGRPGAPGARQCGDAGQRQLAHPGRSGCATSTNTTQHNTMARQLFLTLGAEFAQRRRYAARRRNRRAPLGHQRKLALPGFATGKRLGPVAARAHQHRWPGRAAASRRQLAVCARIHGLLPIAAAMAPCVGALLASRWKPTPKTGSLNDVRALAGYVKRPMVAAMRWWC